MNFRSFSKKLRCRREGPGYTSHRRGGLATGVKLIAAVAVLTVLSGGDLYAQDSGIQVGAFRLHPSFSADIGGDNNIASARSNKDGAAQYTLQGELNVESDWSRHSLTGSIDGSLVGNSEASGCGCSGGIGIGARLDAIGDPNSQKSLSFGIAAGATGLAGNAARNGVLLDERSLERAVRFGVSTQGRVNRFYGSVSGEYLGYEYDDAVYDATRPNPNTTSAFIDSHRNRSRTQIGLSGGYEITPNLRVVGNVGFDSVRYDNTDVSGRVDFDLTNVTSGVQFAVPDSNVGGELEIGAQIVSGKGSGDLDRTTFTSTGSLEWQLRRTILLGVVLSRDFLASEIEAENNIGTDRIKLVLTANTEVARNVELDIEGSVARLDHAVRGSTGTFSIDRSDTQYSLSAKSTYRFTEHYGATATLAYSGLTSDKNFANYQSLYLGVGVAGSY